MSMALQWCSKIFQYFNQIKIACALKVEFEYPLTLLFKFN